MCRVCCWLGLLASRSAQQVSPEVRSALSTSEKQARPTRPTKVLFPTAAPSTKFDNGRAIILAQNANRSWIIGVTAPSWPLHDNQAVKLVLTFDGQAQFDISGTARRDKAVVGTLSSQADQCIGKAHQLVVTATNQTLQFDLAAAGNVAPSIEYCVDKINTNGIAAAGDFSNPKAKPSDGESFRPSRMTSLRKSRPNQTGRSRSQAAVSSSAKTRISSPIITSSPTASATSMAISSGKPPLNCGSSPPTKKTTSRSCKEQRNSGKGHRDDPRQRGEFRRPGRRDRLTPAWSSHLRSDGDDGDHQLFGGAA